MNKNFQTNKICVKIVTEFLKNVSAPVSYRFVELIGLNYNSIKKKYNLSDPHKYIEDFNNPDSTYTSEIVLENMTINCLFDKKSNCIEAWACTNQETDIELRPY